MKFRSQQLKAQPFLAISILGAFLFLLTLAWLNSLIPLLALLAILAIATFALWMMASDFRNLATLYVIVVLFSPSLFRDLSFVSSGVRLDHIVLACVAFLLLFRLLITGRMRRLNLAVVLFALYIVSALITVWLHLGVNPNSSLIGELVAIQGLARPLIVLVVFSILLRTEQQVKNIVWAVVIGGSVMAVFALLQFIHIDVVVDFTANYFDRKVHPVVLGDRGAVVGTFDGLHNSVALFFVLYISLCVALLWNSGAALSMRVKAFIIMAALTAFFGLIGSFSRTGFLALVASIGTILLLRHHSLLGNRLLLVVGSAGLLFTATAITSHFVKFIRVRFIGELLSLDFVLADPRFQVAAPRMFDAFMEHPLFGSGFDLGTAGDIGFLVELASLGLVGFILYFLTISYVMHSAIQVIRLKPTGIYLPLAASVLAVSVGMLVASISGVPFRGTRLMEIYWLLVACLIFAKRDTLMALRNGQLQVDDSDANTTPDSTQRQHSGLTT